MILMPGGRAGRQTASFPPAGNFIKGDPVGTAGEVQGVDADAVEELFRGVYPKLAGWVRRLVDDDDTAHEIATNLIRDHWRKAERERRAIRSVTAGAALDEVAYPVQDVDVRNLIASLP